MILIRWRRKIFIKINIKRIDKAYAICYTSKHNNIKRRVNMNKKQKIKVILLTSIVWVIVIAGAVAVVKYGEYQRTQGMLDGFTKAKEILIQK